MLLIDDTAMPQKAGKPEVIATPSDFDENGALSRAFLFRRGHCCEEGCRNCPYGYQARAKAAQPPEDNIT